MPEPFDTARRHFLDGVAHMQAGRHAEAEAAFEASLALVPSRPSSLMNLGAAQLAQGHAAQALQTLDAAISADTLNAQAYCYRAAALQALGQPERALDDYAQALRIEPGIDAARYQQALLLAQSRQPDKALALLQGWLDDRRAAAAPAWLLAGQCLQTLGRHEEALVQYRQALHLDARLPRAHALLGQALHQLGQAEAAAQTHQQAIEAEMDAALNRYLLAGLLGTNPPARSPDDYVRGLFDPYSADFDQHLVSTLNYRGPTLVADAAARALQHSGRTRFARVLDLGCGTGLCGRALAGLTERITGVDISPTMVEAARRSGAYAEVVQAEAGAFLAENLQSFDLVVAADVFIYIGELEPLLASLSPALPPGAWLIFTVETPAAGETATDGPGWCLRPSLRYAHTRGYIDALATRHGLTLAQWSPAVIRHEQNQPIHGALVALHR